MAGKIFLACAFVSYLFFTIPAFAQSNDSATLSVYAREAELSAGGMCDGSRSTIVVFTGKTYKEMIVFAPASGLKQFYVVKKEAGDEYFIKRIQKNESVEIQKLSAMDWSRELMPESMNFFRFLFFPEHQHDCGVSEKK